MIKGIYTPFFSHEVGAIISEQNQALSIIDGSPGHVDFPEDKIWEIHKFRPGYIHRLAHTHPTGMWEMSGRDKQTLKTWAFALYPFPIRLSTITFVHSSLDNFNGFNNYDFFNVKNTINSLDIPENFKLQGFIEVTYFAELESKETWLARRTGKESRKINIFIEKIQLLDTAVELFNDASNWQQILLEKSFNS